MTGQHRSDSAQCSPHPSSEQVYLSESFSLFVFDISLTQELAVARRLISDRVVAFFRIFLPLPQP